jgi:hypothetical protein
MRGHRGLMLVKRGYSQMDVVVLAFPCDKRPEETAALGADDARQPPDCIIAKDFVQDRLGQSET